jgi:hypothetical protein
MDAAIVPQVANFMQAYTLRGQHTADRACTRYSSDLPKMIENNEITTGPGRYALGVPNAYGNAVFAPNPTVRMQRWGAAHDMSSTKTDVESDLRNLQRPTTRAACGQYNPNTQVARTLTAMPEEDFPQAHMRLVDPPCTLRGSGWNRWEWLCDNPQENVMIPFENNVDSIHAAKDTYYKRLGQPIEQTSIAREHQGLCGNLYVEAAVPVARPQTERYFSDGIPGASQRPATETPPAAIFTARGGPQQGVSNPLAPPRGPVANPIDRHWAETGVLEAPTPFTAFIAPH